MANDPRNLDERRSGAVKACKVPPRIAAAARAQGVRITCVLRGGRPKYIAHGTLGRPWTYEVPRDRTQRRCFIDAAREARPRTYRVKPDAVKALLDANPKLRQLLESDCGRDCAAYTRWVNHGRRGPKPRARPGDGRFDALNERFEKRTPGRKIASWREALAVTAPSTRHWEDLAERLPVLEEAVGFRLNLPDRAEAVLRSRQYIERCESLPPEDEVPF